MYFRKNIETLKEFSDQYKYLEVVESRDFRDADIRLRLRYDRRVVEYRIHPKDLISKNIQERELLAILDRLVDNMINDTVEVLRGKN